MKLMATVALACGFVVAPMVGAAPSSGSPVICDGAGCVPYVAHGVAQGELCVASNRYIYGMDASGNTLACGSKSVWIQFPPLVGVRNLRLPCGDETGVAQSPDGVPLSCVGGAWSSDYRAIYY